AAVSVWQEPQPFEAKTLLPLALGLALAPVPALEPPPAAAAPFCWLFSHLSKAAGVITIAVERMSAWPSPQSSVQITGNVPSRSGVMCSVVVRPGTVSCFCENSGTQD